MVDGKSRELVDAVRDSDLKVAKELLAEGANPNCRTGTERTLLELALLNNDIETFKLLVDSGANITARGRDGYSMLYKSLQNGNMEAAKYLVSKGERFRVKQDIGAGVLITAIRQKDSDMVGLLLKAGVDINSESERQPAIVAAVEEENADMVKLLIDNGADVNIQVYHHSGTPLMLALKRKYYEIVKLLLEQGADTNCGESYDNPLTIVAKQDNLDMLKLLLDKGAIIDAQEPFEDAFRYLKHHCGPKVSAFLEDEYMKKYRPNAKRVRFDPLKITDTKFENIVGMERVKSELRRDILYHLKHAELAKEYGLTLRGGIMLFGPPGCGKTFITKAVAGESGVNFIEAKVSDIFDMYVGSEGKAMKQLFAKARKSTPCILFFDEMELLGGNRESTGHYVWAREALNVFLTEMDGANSNNDGLLIIGATNAPWMVDPALKRNGRLGKFIYVSPPDYDMRAGLFRMYLNKRPLEDDIDYAKLAAESGECNAADIPAICNEAAKLAWEDSIVSGVKRKISMEDMQKSLKKETYNMKEWFQNVKQHMAIETNKNLYSELNDSLKQIDSTTQGGSSYR
jgi:AAA+ superfamily predicted ATPase